MKLELHNICLTLKNAQILSDISFIAKEGEVIGLEGINGSGKTMLLRVIAGLVKASSGEVLVNGQVLGKDFSFPPRTGILIENPAFLSNRTGLENLQILTSLADKSSDDTLKDLLYQVGLNPDDCRKFSKYSLGMKQKLGIAAACMDNPDLILLDEPSNALDTEGTQLLQKIIQRAKEHNATILIASHDHILLNSLADTIYVLADGRITNTRGGE